MRRLKQQLAAVALAVVILVIGVGVVQTQRAAQAGSAGNVAGARQIAQAASLSVAPAAGQTRSYDFNFSYGDSAEQALLKLAADTDFDLELQEFSFGKLVVGVNGVKPGANKAFWQFEVNGKPAEVGISDYKLQPGDSLALRYIEL
jgi:hypothetical protein